MVAARCAVVHCSSGGDVASAAGPVNLPSVSVRTPFKSFGAWRSYIWHCFECPWMSHAWIRQEHRCNNCLFRRRGLHILDKENRSQVGLTDD